MKLIVLHFNQNGWKIFCKVKLGDLWQTSLLLQSVNSNHKYLHITSHITLKAWPQKWLLYHNFKKVIYDILYILLSNLE